MMNKDEKVALITKVERTKVKKAREKLRQAEKELDLVYRSIYNIPQNAIAPLKWYHDENITVLYKPESAPIVVIGEFTLRIKEWYSAQEVMYTFVRINGVWQ